MHTQRSIEPRASRSKELARPHRGDILVSSEIGKASTFIIRLMKGNDHFRNDPLVEIMDDLATPGSYSESDYLKSDEDAEMVALLADTTGKHLALVVEDDHEILNYTCQSLRTGFNAIGAMNGQEGLHGARRMNPDLIITGVRMPGMDGIEITRRFKEEFETSHIPVIMLTAVADITDQITGIDSGAVSQIVKPFHRSIFDR